MCAAFLGVAIALALWFVAFKPWLERDNPEAPTQYVVVVDEHERGEGSDLTFLDDQDRPLNCKLVQTSTAPNGVDLTFTYRVDLRSL